MHLAKIGPDGVHDFILPGEQPVVVDEGWWHRFVGSDVARRKAEADAVSYIWDKTIELFATHFRGGTAQHLSELDAASHARLLYFFARENRMRRRMLANTLVDMMRTTGPDQRRLRVIQPSRPGDPYWVLFLLPFPEHVANAEYREMRRHFLNACLYVTKLMNPDAVDIAGFATEVARGAAGSEDAAYLDAREWSEELADEARRFQRDYQILVKPRMIRATDNEYPL